MLKAKVPRSFAALTREMKGVMDLEDEADAVGLIRGQSYMDGLTMHENAPPTGDLLGAVSARSRAAGLAEVALYNTGGGAQMGGDAGRWRQRRPAAVAASPLPQPHNRMA